MMWFLFQRLVGEGATMYQLERVVRVVWPSSLWLMATDGIEDTPRAYVFILLSIAINILLYGVVGTAAWSVKYFVADRSKR